MDEARYRVALRIAKAGFRRLGRRSIDGKEPHDIAMQSLDREPWQPRRVWLDCIDAYRRERGRNCKRQGMRLVGLRDNLAAKPVEWFELGLVLKGRTEVLVCKLGKSFAQLPPRVYINLKGQVFCVIKASSLRPLRSLGLIFFFR